MPQMFLPFDPHMFHTIHFIEETLINHKILYLNQIKDNVQNLVNSAANSILCDAMFRQYGLSVDNKERHIALSKADI